MAIAAPEVADAVEEVTPQEGRAIFDRAARRHLQMSGDEFLRRWDAGEFRDGPERTEVIHVAILMPFAR